MNKLVYRNCSLAQLIVCIFVYGMVVILCTIAMYITITIDDPAFLPAVRFATAFAYGALFCLPCLGLIIASCIAYTETIVITDDAVIFYRGTRQINRIPRTEITVVGCASFMYRNGYSFFCSEPMDNILNYAQHHQKEMIRLFGKQRVDEALKTEEVYRQIAIGTYIERERKKKQGSIIILKEAQERHMKELKKVWQQNLVFTGPVFMDHPETWNKYK